MAAVLRIRSCRCQAGERLVQGDRDRTGMQLGRAGGEHDVGAVDRDGVQDSVAPQQHVDCRPGHQLPAASHDVRVADDDGDGFRLRAQAGQQVNGRARGVGVEVPVRAGRSSMVPASQVEDLQWCIGERHSRGDLRGGRWCHQLST